MKLKATSLSFPDSLQLQPQENLSLLPYLQKISIHYLIPPKKSKSADLPTLPLLQKKQTELNSEFLDDLYPQKYQENTDLNSKSNHITISKKNNIKSIRDSRFKRSFIPIEKMVKKASISGKSTPEELVDVPFEFNKNKDLDQKIEEKKMKKVCSKDFEDNSEERPDQQKKEQQKIAYEFAFEEEKEDFREAKRNFFSYQKKLRRKGQSTDLQENKVKSEEIVYPNERKKEENAFLPLLPKYKERKQKEEVKYSFEKLMKINYQDQLDEIRRLISRKNNPKRVQFVNS